MRSERGIASTGGSALDAAQMVMFLASVRDLYLPFGTNPPPITADIGQLGPCAVEAPRPATPAASFSPARTAPSCRTPPGRSPDAGQARRRAGASIPRRRASFIRVCQPSPVAR